MVIRRQHRCPIIGPAGLSQNGKVSSSVLRGWPSLVAYCWMSTRNLCHSQADEEGEEANDDPPDRHNARTASCKAILEECRDSSDDGDNAEADSEVVYQTPIAVQFLFVTRLCKSALVSALRLRRDTGSSESLHGRCVQRLQEAEESKRGRNKAAQ